MNSYKVTNAHIGSISVSCKEGVLPLSYRLLGNNVATLKTPPDVHQAADLELLWVLVDHLQEEVRNKKPRLDSHLSLQSVDQRVRVEEDWSIWKANLSLSHRLQILFGHAGLADRPGKK